MASKLEFRDDILATYPDVLTPAALAALEALAPLDRDRRAAHGGAARAARRAGARAAPDRLPRSRRGHPGHRRSASRDARAGDFDGQRDPARPRAAVDPGHRARRPSRARRSRAACATSPTRCSRAPTAGCSTARTRSARSTRCRSTTSATSSWRSPGTTGLPASRRAGRRRDERLGARLLRPRDRRRLAARSSTSRRSIFRCRGLHLDDRHVRDADGTGFSASIVDLVLYVVNNQRALRAEGRSIVLYLPKIQTAEEAALWNDMLARARGAPRAAGRHDQGLRPGRADRGLLPADGDPRRARAALRRLQHRPLGLHQQRRRRDRLGSRLRQPEHRRDRDDLRLHAQLRGPRAPRGQHARPQRPLRALAGRHGAEHPGRLGGGRRRRHEAGRSPAASASSARARAASGSPTGRWSTSSGRSGRRPARSISSAGRSRRSTYTDGGRRGPDAARAGAAHRRRRARPAERGPAVRQRLRPRLPGRRAQAGRLLRQRRRALPDGGHGDRRDPAQHPLGVAAQEGRASPTTTRRPASRAGDAFDARALRPAARRGVRQAAARRATATSTTTRRRRRCRSRARSSRAYVDHEPKPPWYVDLLNLNLDNHDLGVARRAHRRATWRRSAGTARGSPRTSTSPV